MSQSTSSSKAEFEALTGLLEEAKSYAIDYAKTLDERSVYPTPSAIEALSAWERPLTKEGEEARVVLEELHRIGSPATVATAGSRYFGFVIGGALPVTVATSWLAAMWDQCPGFFVGSPTVAKIEEVCERWLVELFGFPKETAVGFLTGATTANFSALAAARYELLRRQGWAINEQGLFGAPPLRIVASEQIHASVLKSLAMLGLGTQRCERVPVDAQGRLMAAQLPKLDAQTIVLIQAGNVNSGAFDPFEEVCLQAQESGAWVHVDGAFGLWAAASPRRAALVRGLAMADSWAVDAHKYLNVPYDSGLVLCRHRSALSNAMRSSATYFQYTEGYRDSCTLTPELSRRARAIDVWAALRVLGRDGIEDLIERTCDLAVLFATLLRQEGFQILNDVVYNQVLVACDTPEQTTATLNAIQRSGECWCGGSTWQQQPVIRVSVSSWKTTEEDVHRSVKAFVEARRSVS